jgi:hypothetical protein
MEVVDLKAPPAVGATERGEQETTALGGAPDGGSGKSRFAQRSWEVVAHIDKSDDGIMRCTTPRQTLVHCTPAEAVNAVADMLLCRMIWAGRKTCGPASTRHPSPRGCCRP